jgi:glycosyltransferase involved in cell wall biosynthesis
MDSDALYKHFTGKCAYSIIIATCGRPDRLAKTLECIRVCVERAGDGHEVLVVDNGDDRAADEVVKKFAGVSGVNIRYLQSGPGNKAKALNLGIANAKNDWLAFTDDDTLPDPGWLDQAARYQSATGLDIFGGRVTAEPEKGFTLPRWLRAGQSGRVPRGPAIVDFDPLLQDGILAGNIQVPLGSNIFVHKRVFEACDGYDEELWRRCGSAALGCEDAEFSMRVRKRGIQVGYCRESIVVHPIYRDRATIRNHWVWAWRFGRREPVLFHEEISPKKSFHQLIRLPVTGMQGMAHLVGGDSAAFVCDMMTIARVLGEL